MTIKQISNFSKHRGQALTPRRCWCQFVEDMLLLLIFDPFLPWEVNKISEPFPLAPKGTK